MNFLRIAAQKAGNRLTTAITYGKLVKVFWDRCPPALLLDVVIVGNRGFFWQLETVGEEKALMNAMSTRLVLACAVAVSISTSASASLMITEIVDATLPGGQPKFVELKNVSSDPLDLSNFSIGNFNNGGTTLGGGQSTLLSGTLNPNDLFIVAYESAPTAPAISTFEQVYGFVPDLFLGAFINGDDVVAVFQGLATGDGSDSTIVDIYGVIGVDGTGEVWDYTDGFSFRNPDVMSTNSTFAPGEWTFGGPDSLETGDDDEELILIRQLTNPGTHNMIPEPSSILLALMGASAVGAVGMRRRLG